MPHQIRPQPGIMDIALYQGGTAKISGRDDALKLSSNEKPVRGRRIGARSLSPRGA